MIECTVCHEKKPVDQYPKNGKDKEGNTRYRKDCKVCYSITRKLTKRKAVTKFVNNTKHRTGEVDTYNLEDWRAAMLHFRGCCAYCGNPPIRGRKLHRDHIVPVSGGGDTSRKNIAPSCKSCNSSKGDRDVHEWFPKRKSYTVDRHERLRDWIG